MGCLRQHLGGGYGSLSPTAVPPNFIRPGICDMACRYSESSKPRIALPRGRAGCACLIIPQLEVIACPFQRPALRLAYATQEVVKLGGWVTCCVICISECKRQ